MFKIVTTQDELLKAFCVRNIVFVEEQRCSYAIEYDGEDPSALHILGEQDGEPVAAARIRFFGDYAKLERIAVRVGYRGSRLGQQLVTFMVQVARQRGFLTYKMHAQAHLEGFYRALGFEAYGEHFEEAGIDHVAMVRQDDV